MRARRYHLEQPIADRVAEHIVDRLEIIEIETMNHEKLLTRTGRDVTSNHSRNASRFGKK